MKLISLEKALQTIELLNQHPQGLRLLELSQKLGFPKSSIHHTLSTFLPYNYVIQDPDTKRYFIGFKFLSIGKAFLDNIDVRKISTKYLRELFEECNEPVHLYILRGGQIICIDKLETPGRLSLVTYIGFSTDPHAAAAGKVLLCELPSDKIAEIYNKRKLHKYGKKTITRLSQLMKELEEVRKQGYAIDDEEYYEGVRCVAAPVRAGGQIVAAISITGSTITMSMELIQQVLKHRVMATAERISSELRW
jgi:DNA-binding IclR family transcriptional regulator